ncbi:MAG: hypothetical protein R2865_14945 [Deinococcales bacterium]
MRTKGAWEAWLLFFPEGVYITSQQPDMVKSLLSLFQKDKKAIESLAAPQFGFTSL